MRLDASFELPDERKGDLRKGRILATGLVAAANVRLRDMGHVLTGEIYARPTGGEAPGVEVTRRLVREALRIDWRLQDLSLVWVEELPDDQRVAPLAGRDP